MQLKAPASWTDPQETKTRLDVPIPQMSRRRLLGLAGATLLVGGCLKLEVTRLRPISRFWSDGTGWVE